MFKPICHRNSGQGVLGQREVSETWSTTDLHPPQTGIQPHPPHLSYPPYPTSFLAPPQPCPPLLTPVWKKPMDFSAFHLQRCQTVAVSQRQGAQTRRLVQAVISDLRDFLLTSDLCPQGQPDACPRGAPPRETPRWSTHPGHGLWRRPPHRGSTAACVCVCQKAGQVGGECSTRTQAAVFPPPHA